jgi:hypothetical protein
MPPVLDNDAKDGFLKRELPVQIRGEPKDNTIEVVLVSNNNGGRRFDWESGDYYIEELDPKGADTSRGLSFFKDHIASVDNAVGRVDNIRVENDELISDIHFGSDEDSQRVLQKYRDGILTDVSIRYTQDEYTEQEIENGYNIRTITKYTLFEVSAVGIGFDAGAKKREAEMTKEELEKLNKENAEKQRKLDDATDNLSATEQRALDAEKEVDDVKVQLREANRVNEIDTLQRELGADNEFVAKYREDKSQDASTMAIDYAKSLADKSISLRVGNAEAPEDIQRQAEDAIFQRMGGKVDTDSIFARATIMDIAKELTGVSDREDALQRSITTSTLPKLLGGAGNRLLVQEFNEAPITYQQWTDATDRNDFNVYEDVTFQAGGILDKISEGGEIPSAKVSEQSESVKIENFGKKYQITLQAMRNDQLGAFSKLLQTFGRSSALTAEVLMYQLLTKTGAYANYKMADGKPIFHNDHKNLLDLALDSASLTTAKQKMRDQVLKDGTNAYIIPKFLVVGTALEATAKVLTHSSSVGGSNSGEFNVHQSAFTVIVSPELGATEWYITADNRTLGANYLAGTGRKPMIQVDNTSLLGITYEGIFQFGANAIDYRGMVKGK